MLDNDTSADNRTINGFCKNSDFVFVELKLNELSSFLRRVRQCMITESFADVVCQLRRVPVLEQAHSVFALRHWVQTACVRKKYGTCAHQSFENIDREHFAARRNNQQIGVNKGLKLPLVVQKTCKRDAMVHAELQD